MSRLKPRSGFTLIELTVAMFMLMILMAGTIMTFNKSSVLLGGQSGRLEAQEGARFAVTTLDRDLRVAGVGVVDEQPLLVEAANTAIVFNADLISVTPGDPGSVYVDTSADTSMTSVMNSASKLALPELPTVFYPESTYVQSSGIRSGAETIAYYLQHDSTSSLSNEYVLYRRVNATTPEIIARSILYNTGDTVFRYFKIDTTGAVTAVPMTSLPLYHKAVIHGSAADTGKYAIVDSIMSVTATFKSFYQDPHTDSIVIRPITTQIRIMNAMLIRRTTCGDPPIGVTPSFTTSVAGAEVPFVQLTWNASTDDGGGENDVITYAIYRRLSSATSFDQPFASVPAGSSTYTFTDNNVSPGDSWVYGVSAQDCTPSSSSIGTTSTVVVP
jgi:hypothetical protein